MSNIFTKLQSKDSEHATANEFTLGPVIRPERFLFVKY